MIALVLGGLLTWRQADLWRGLSQANQDVQTITGWDWQSDRIAAQLSQALLTGQAADLAVISGNLNTLIDSLGDGMRLVDGTFAYDTQALALIAQTTLNTARSLETLMQANAQAEAQLRQDVLQMTDQLTTAADALSRQAAADFDQRLQNAEGENLRLQVALLGILVAALLFGVVRYLRLAQTTDEGLDALVRSVQAITVEHIPKQSPIPQNDRIGKLAATFNAMATTLQTAMQTESAANEQNRRQIIKLAQQERMTAILEERQRIARELHDSVKQQLFSITLATGAALNLIDHDAALAKTYLAHVQQMGTLAQSEMTTLLQEMNPLPLHDLHLEDAIYQYLAPLCELHRLKLLWRVEGTNTLTITQEHTLFRIVQEAASNVVRHSKAIVLRVSLHFGLQTRLVIEDDGEGFDPEAVPLTSTGLATMRLRVKQVGGRLTLTSIIGQGTRLEIILDLRRK